jgi:putative transcriptional regulator
MQVEPLPGGSRFRLLLRQPVIVAAVALLAVLSVIGLRGTSHVGGAAPLPSANSCIDAPSAYRVQSRQIPTAELFLVAARGLRDPNFSQSVVLLIHDEREGAFGLIINRPTEYTVADVLPDMAGMERHHLYLGGPVEMRRLLFLFRSDTAYEEAQKAFDGVFLGSDAGLLKRIIAEGRSEFRLYAGYSGWAPGQLDYELSRGDWHLLPADSSYVFSEDPGKVWSELIEQVDIRSAVGPRGGAQGQRYSTVLAQGSIVMSPEEESTATE